MRLFCCIFNHCFFGIFYDLQPTWTSGKVLASPALDSPGLVKALRSMMTTSKRFWHRSRRNAQTLKTNKIHEDEKWRGAQINRGKRKPIKYHETSKLQKIVKSQWFCGVFFSLFDEKNCNFFLPFSIGCPPHFGNIFTPRKMFVKVKVPFQEKGQSTRFKSDNFQGWLGILCSGSWKPMLFNGI